MVIRCDSNELNACLWQYGWKNAIMRKIKQFNSAIKNLVSILKKLKMICLAQTTHYSNCLWSKVSDEAHGQKLKS